MAKTTPTALLREPSFPSARLPSEATEAMDGAAVAARGAIFTRREVVEFILDLIGYDAASPLEELRLLEPSFGFGDFLLPAIDRLLLAWKRTEAAPALLADAIRGVEVHRASFDHTHALVVQKLRKAGFVLKDAVHLANHWLVHDDFLLVPLTRTFDVVVGNPPYVRHELVPDALMAEYRSRYKTIYDRADLYVPFIERSLDLLAPRGKLGFICADRWMKNRYGGPLRAKIANDFRLSVYVDMAETSPFHHEVVAYPAITVFEHGKPALTRIVRRPEISDDALSRLSATLRAKTSPAPDSGVQEVPTVAHDSDPWILESSDQFALLRRLEAQFPFIEDTGCKIGIGVATGADSAFIAPFSSLDIEDSRKLPLATTDDITNGTVEWRGLGVVNPFGDDGKLVKLDRFPKLKRYLEAHRDQIARRHIAQKNPAKWYRTIDRIYPALAARPKLLIPDIKRTAHIVYEPGNLYPHHNLYFITSDTWELRALQAVLRSGIARLFVATYSTRMRGGYMRFQAQYLRRIRLPKWADIPLEMRQALKTAAETENLEACNALTFEIYGLSARERASLGGEETQ